MKIPAQLRRIRSKSIPTLLVFKDGKPAERIVGAVPQHVIVDTLHRVVA